MYCGCNNCGMLSNNKDIIYQVHITVKASQSDFKIKCRELQVQPIIIHNIVNNNMIIDMFTSHNFTGSDEFAFDEMERVASALSCFEVVRKKIEVVPWHPQAPTLNNGFKHLDTQYFEAHIKCEQLLSDSRLRYSKNILKSYMLGTYRDTLSYDAFLLNLNTMAGGLPRVIEWAMYDSNVQHDKEWMK